LFERVVGEEEEWEMEKSESFASAAPRPRLKSASVTAHQQAVEWVPAGLQGSLRPDEHRRRRSRRIRRSRPTAHLGDDRERKEPVVASACRALATNHAASHRNGAPSRLSYCRSRRHHHHRTPAFLAPRTPAGPGPFVRCGCTVAYTAADRRRLLRPLRPVPSWARFSIALLAGPDATRPERTTRHRACTGRTPRHACFARLSTCAAIRAATRAAICATATCYSLPRRLLAAALAGRRPTQRSSLGSRHLHGQPPSCHATDIPRHTCCVSGSNLRTTPHCPPWNCPSRLPCLATQSQPLRLRKPIRITRFALFDRAR
jgi:hypothetical protein